MAPELEAAGLVNPDWRTRQFGEPASHAVVVNVQMTDDDVGHIRQRQSDLPEALSQCHASFWVVARGVNHQHAVRPTLYEQVHLARRVADCDFHAVEPRSNFFHCKRKFR